MTSIILIIIILVILVATCVFVNDTKKKHGVCCGKLCAGCPTNEEDIKKH